MQLVTKLLTGKITIFTDTIINIEVFFAKKSDLYKVQYCIMGKF